MQGSVVSCQLSNDSQQATEEKRQLLKSQLRLAWSGEAVKQGVAHAKKAEYDTALGCYKKVIQATHFSSGTQASQLTAQCCSNRAATSSSLHLVFLAGKEHHLAAGCVSVAPCAGLHLL